MSKEEFSERRTTSLETSRVPSNKSIVPHRGDPGGGRLLFIAVEQTLPILIIKNNK